MKDKISKIKNIKIYHIILLYFLMQPFLEMYATFHKSSLQIFGMSMTILLNFVIVFIIMVYAVFLLLKNNKGKLKKEFIITLGYCIIFLIYCILHYKNMVLFNDKIFERNSYDFIREMYYIFRAYVLPIVFLYTLYSLKLDKNKILFIIRMSVFIICFTIIVTNILGVSLAAYAEFGKLIYIDGNIFHWLFFDGGDNFELYTSKGWFRSANELSVILLMMSPIIISDFYKATTKKNRIFSLILVVMLIITMNMLGTRTAVLGIFASLICIIIIFIVFKLIKKYDFDIKKFMIRSIFLIGICICIFINSPYYNKNYGEFKTEFKDRPLDKDVVEAKAEDIDNFSKFLEKYYWNYYIEPILLDIYPVNKDTEFWEEMINRDLRLNSNYRIIKTDLYNRIIERNDNKADLFLGIGYNDILNSEKDYDMQKYHFGIFGVIILIGPYIINVLYALYRLFKYKTSMFKIDNVISLMVVCIGLIAPYLTGHVFGSIFSMSYLVICSVLLLTLFKNDELIEND